MPSPFNREAFEETIRKHWVYHSPSEQVYLSVDMRDDGIFEIDAAPVFQEVWGGKSDGKKVWAAFEIDLFGLSQEEGFEIECCGATSQCVACCGTPYIGIKGEYHEVPFILKIHLEPVPDSGIREIVDTVRHEVREINLADENS